MRDAHYSHFIISHCCIVAGEEGGNEFVACLPVELVTLRLSHEQVVE